MDSPAKAAAPHFTARIEPGGSSFDAPADQALLVAAAQAGLELPNSCRNGTCRTCLCRLVSGRVSYRIQWPGLLPEEKAEGFTLPCVAFPESDVVLSWATR
jgi:ferredoxin